MYGDSPRKPSGSSTHSASHSPSASSNVQPLKASTIGRMLSVGIPPSQPKLGLGSTPNWLSSWDASSPSSRRNPSVSSVNSGADLSTTTATSLESSYWPKSRPNSGNWEDDLGSPQKADLSQLHPDSPLGLAPRQRQFSGSRVDERGQRSPQRYDTAIGKDTNSSMYPSGASPTRPYGASGGYDGLRTADDLTAALRGMNVKDDFAVRPPMTPSSQPLGLSGSSGANSPGARGQFPAAFPQQDYNGFYPSPVGHPNVFPSPSLTSPIGPTAYPLPAPNYTSVNDMNRSGLFFDYNAPRAPGSSFFYPQPLMFPSAHSPVVTSFPGTPASFSDKKRDISLSLQQNLAQQTLYGRTRPTSAGSILDFGSALPSPVFGPNGVPMYPVVRRGRQDGRPVFTFRSALLDDFRNNKHRRWVLRDIAGFVVEFCGDQHGSRFIQYQIEVATPEERQAVFDEIVPTFTLQLVMDVFGNYVIQKLLEYGTPIQRAIICNSMDGHILQLSTQMYGCRVVQKALDYVGPEKQAAWVKEIEAHVLKCVKDSNGNHVIQKMIERIPSDILTFIEAFQGHVLELSTHPYGCRVLQRCLEHIPESRTRLLLNELVEHACALAMDQFGNYVVQFVIEHGSSHDRLAVLYKMRGHMVQLARHKFASNVCEKALMNGDAESRHPLIKELMEPLPEGGNTVALVMKDQFANYVLQRALQNAEGRQREELVALSQANLTALRKLGHHSKQIGAIERTLGLRPVIDQLQLLEYPSLPIPTVNLSAAH